MSSTRSITASMALRTLKELTRSYLTITRDLTRDGSAEGHLPQLGYSVCWRAGIRTSLPCRVAAEDLGKWGTSSRRALLSAVRRSGSLASRSTARTFSRKSETLSHKITAANSLDWSDPLRSVDRDSANTHPFPHQAAAVGLLWFGTEDLHQRGISFRQGPTTTFKEGPGHSWSQPQP